jgi:hypothetical protein
MIQKNKKKYQSMIESSDYKCNTRKGVASIKNLIKEATKVETNEAFD